MVRRSRPMVCRSNARSPLVSSHRPPFSSPSLAGVWSRNSAETPSFDPLRENRHPAEHFSPLSSSQVTTDPARRRDPTAGSRARPMSTSIRNALADAKGTVVRARSHARRRLPSRDADDGAASLLLKMVEAAASEPATEWSSRGLDHALVDHIRRERRYAERHVSCAGPALDEAADHQRSPPDILLSRLCVRRLLDDGLRRLASAERAAVELRIIHGVEWPAIGAILGKSVSTAQRLIASALLKLRAQLEASGVDSGVDCDLSGVEVS